MEQQSYPDYDNLSPEAKVFLDRELVSFEISVRTEHYITKGHYIDGNPFRATYVREVASKTDADLLRIKNFGRKSLDELKEVFEYGGVRIGMSLPPEVVEHGSAAYEAKRNAASEPHQALAPIEVTPIPLPVDICNLAFEHLREVRTSSFNFTAQYQAVTVRFVFQLLDATLDSVIEHVSKTQALAWRDELLHMPRDSYPQDMIGPLLYKLWGVVEKTKSTNSA